MAIDSHTTTTAPASTSPPTVDPPLAESTSPESCQAFFESGAAPSLKLDIPSTTLPASPSAVSSAPPSPSPSPIPLAAHSGSGSTTTTDTTASSASPHTSLSPSLPSSSSSSSLPPAPSSTTTLNVKFAPLPQLAPRKRRSTAPLGMAARGQLVRGQQRRRAPGSDAGGAPPHSALPPDVVLTPAQLEELRLKQEAAAARYAHIQGSAHALAARETEAEVIEEEEAKEARAREKAERERERAGERGGEKDPARAAHWEEDEDPLQTLGKAVKGVGRFWRRRVASRDDVDVGPHKDGERAVRRRKSDLGRHTDSSAASSSSSSPPPVPPVPPMPLRPILANITTNITPVAPLPQSPLGDDAATIVPRRRAKSKTGADGEQVDREQNEDERTQEETQETRDQAEREQRQELKDDNEEQGGVWEEEIGDGIPFNAGQTQTIVGGRVVASVVSVAAASGASASSPTTTTTTTIEVTATATAAKAKAHGKKDGAGKPEGARLVKAAVRSSLIRRGKPQVGGAQA